MADETIFITKKNIPLLLHDNGDGTYSLGASAEVSKEAVTPTLYNTTLTAADTEYSQALAACKGIEFQARTAVDIRFAFVTGKVATPTAPYMTLKAGQWYYFDGSPTTLYLASSVAGTIVEIILWS